MLLRIKHDFYVELLHVEDIFMYHTMPGEGNRFRKEEDRLKYGEGKTKVIVTNTRGGYSYSWLNKEEREDLCDRLLEASI